MAWHKFWTWSALSLALLIALAAFEQQRSAVIVAGPACSGTGAIDSEERLLLDLINGYRADHDLSPYTLSHHLNRSASWKVNDIAAHGYFAHDDTPIGRPWGQRIRDCGYRFNVYLGENLAGGDSTAAGALDIWQHSPGHDALLLSDTFRAIGIGRAKDGNGYWYWAMDVGGQTDPRRAGGDVDCDDDIDTIDAGLVLQRAAGYIISLRCETEADLDNSASVTAMDALLLLQNASRQQGS
jgi:uncharacterized protein YkwD